MDNNNNNNNTTSSAVIAPPRPPDPPGHTATATTTARPAAKPGNATIAPSTDAASSPLMHDIANCVIIKNSSATSFDQVLLALDKHYPNLAGATPCVIKGQSALRFPKDADLDTLIAKGLPIGRITCLFEKLFTSTEGGVIQCTLTGFFSDTEGLRLFREKITPFGKVLFQRIHYIGKTKHISGVLHIEPRNFRPP